LTLNTLVAKLLILDPNPNPLDLKVTVELKFTMLQFFKTLFIRVALLLDAVSYMLTHLIICVCVAHQPCSVALHGEQLRAHLRVINTDDKPFEFTAALHSYFEVLDISKAKVRGLKGEQKCNSCAPKALA